MVFSFINILVKFAWSEVKNYSLVGMPEWLMGSPAKRLCNARLGSNPSADVILIIEKI